MRENDSSISSSTFYVHVPKKKYKNIIKNIECSQSYCSPLTSSHIFLNLKSESGLKSVGVRLHIVYSLVLQQQIPLDALPDSSRLNSTSMQHLPDITDHWF